MINDFASRLLLVLRQGGSLSSSELQAATGVSQPTLWRALTPLLASGQILRFGRTRRQVYVAPRSITGVPATIPILRVDGSGQVAPFGLMVPLAGGRFWLDELGGPAAVHDGLPWFLSDMRPQGFIGRTFANAHPELGLAKNPEHWNDDDVLRALVAVGEDLPGNLIVGDASFTRYHAQVANVTHVSSPDEYPELAQRAILGHVPGSSAGGEQPKFCVVREGVHRIVKFSPGEDSLVDQRLRDLLVCEHLALRTLQDGASAAAISQIHFASGRAFLDVVRFDRTERGRVGMVSLLAYDAEHVGQSDNWGATAQRMLTRGLLCQEDADRLALLEAFGVLIGNTDRHYGNISLLMQDGEWRLAPAYDMLPMAYIPRDGKAPMDGFTPAAHEPTAYTLQQWPRAMALAGEFWRSVAMDARISQEFRDVAQGHAEHFAARVQTRTDPLALDAKQMAPDTVEAAEALLRSQGLEIITDEEIETYNASRFDHGAFNPKIHTDLLEWEVNAGMMKRTFFIKDPSCESRGLRRTAWYYPQGIANGDGLPVLILEDEEGREITMERMDPLALGELREIRVAALPRLANTAGASYTFWQMATQAIRQAQGGADGVDWRAVEDAAIAQCIGRNAQTPESVRKTLCEHSPGAVSPERQAELAVSVQRAAVA